MNGNRIGGGPGNGPQVNPGGGPEGAKSHPSHPKTGDPQDGGGPGRNGNGAGNAPGQLKKQARAEDVRFEGEQNRTKLNNPRNPVSNLPGDEPRGNARGWQRNQPDSNALPNGNHLHGHDLDNGNQTSHLPQPVADGLNNLTSSAANYLLGLTKGRDLTPEMRQVLDASAGLLGRDFVATLKPGHDGGTKAFKFVERALAHVNHNLEKASDRAGQTQHAAGEAVRSAVGEILEAAHLERYFDRLAKTGGGVVRQAEGAVARVLYGVREGDGGGDGGRFPRSPIHPGEVLRDLRSGAFLPAEENYNPFPLTGRARVVTEMMELMRTLDAIDRAMQGVGGGEARQGESLDALLAAYLKGGVAGKAASEMLDKLLAALLPALPGKAGRVELLRLIAALGGTLVDAEGRPLTAKDGTPLKLDGLLWLGTLGGTSRSFAAESFPVNLSPLLLYGFDALYSVIGFDGRTLNPPHFAAVQSQVNGSELEWVFGQPPLTEGWMRALIERLKDSASADHNLLGEMLEDALADGRFHAVLVSGRVEEGEPVADSFSVTKLLPGASGETAFSPA